MITNICCVYWLNKLLYCCSVDIKSERITLDLQFGGTSLAIGVYTCSVKDLRYVKINTCCK
jgi:hypothetical protein